MDKLLAALESLFGRLPLPLLEVWGRFAFVSGSVLALAAFGGFTFRPAGRWGFGREQQSWDAKALLSILLTFILIIVTGYLGSFVVLVPGAQTLESLKDLVVLLAIVLFGYHALLAVPFAYGVSDLIEGVPPAFLRDWLPGYFINPACFWIAYQAFGKDPDFRRARTWGRYAAFVVAFMAIEPVLWGYICSPQFGSAISYRYISSALVFTTSVTWLLAPGAFLFALPLARQAGLFWAEIPGHVKERFIGREHWAWEAGREGQAQDLRGEGWPIRLVLLAPFIALMLLMVGATAYVTLRSAAEDEQKLAGELHNEISTNIHLLLDEQLRLNPRLGTGQAPLSALLRALPIARYGQALLLSPAGAVVAGTATEPSPVGALAAQILQGERVSARQLQEGHDFQFSHVTQKPLARTAWLAHAQSYEPPRPGGPRWTILTLMPESYFLAGVQAGNSRSALIFSLALLLSVATAALLASTMTGDLRQISRATQALAEGDLSRQAPGSHIEELDALARAFNSTAAKLAASMEELRGNEERMRLNMQFVDTLIDSLPGVVLLYDPSGAFLRWNRGLLDATGYSAEEIPGLAPYGLVPPDQIPAIQRTIEAVMSEGQHEVELLLLAKDGRQIPYYFKGVRLPTEKGTHILSVGLDVSDRRRLEGQFQQAQKMEAVGNLAGGIAHDFNNLLTVIMSCGEIIKAELPPADPLQTELDQVMAASRSAAELTRRLLALSRKQLLRPELMDMGVRVREMEKLLRRVIGEDISLALVLEPGPCLCKADPTQVEQALLNLALNARDAMPQGGSLTLECACVLIDEDYCRQHVQAKPGPYVRVSLADSGSGMEPEILARAFEPFFTTKGVGKGSGLGLSMVYGAVQQSGGFVSASSRPGEGARFELHFPRAVGAALDALGGSSAEELKGGSECILLVEDEAAVRERIAQVLRSMGYQVLTAGDGQEGLERAQNSPLRIDILVSDVVMPRLSGPAMAEVLQARDPGLRVLFVSGHTDDAALRHGLQQGQMEFLQKPYTPAELAQKVRAVLDKGKAA